MKEKIHVSLLIKQLEEEIAELKAKVIALQKEKEEKEKSDDKKNYFI